MRRGTSDVSSFDLERTVSFVYLRRLRASRLARAEDCRAHHGDYKPDACIENTVY
jgi:hypothetical protein